MCAHMVRLVCFVFLYQLSPGDDCLSSARCVQSSGLFWHRACFESVDGINKSPMDFFCSSELDVYLRVDN